MVLLFPLTPKHASLPLIHTHTVLQAQKQSEAQHKSAAFLPCVIACSLVDVVDYLFELEICTDETKIMAFNFI